MAYMQMNWKSRFLKNNQTVSFILPEPTKGAAAKDFYGNGELERVLDFFGIPKK